MTIEELVAEEKRMRRAELRGYALAALRFGSPDGKALLEIVLAALEYGDSEHTFDSNCSAGDCDSCSARDALKRLEELLGGPGRSV